MSTSSIARVSSTESCGVLKIERARLFPFESIICCILLPKQQAISRNYNFSSKQFVKMQGKLYSLLPVKVYFFCWFMVLSSSRVVNFLGTFMFFRWVISIIFPPVYIEFLQVGFISHGCLRVGCE